MASDSARLAEIERKLQNVNYNSITNEELRARIAEVDAVFIQKVEQAERFLIYRTDSQDILNNASQFQRSREEAKRYAAQAKTVIQSKTRQLETEQASFAKKAKEDIDYLPKAEQTLKEYPETFKSLGKEIEATENNMKNVLNNIDYVKLGTLNVISNVQLQKIFKLIFTLFYDEPEENFDWTTFKKAAIQQDKGADLQKRMASFSVKGASKEKIQAVGKLNSDAEFQDWVVKDPQGEALLDMCEYFDYIPQLRDNYDQYTERAMYHKNLEKHTTEVKHRIETSKMRTQLINDSQNDLQNLDRFLIDLERRLDEINSNISSASGGRLEQLPPDVQAATQEVIKPIPSTIYS
eukprot:TRINITY_DN3124_c0_g1_i1.p1 TRINITY_DN3124_c0_g1~~TRINITY_DN3124_c0_g1_i1.p1  ORF type:complete len:351 (-),score=131.89 TRINITY_DN3124_c0_g1_i1:987-2039(-)